MKGYVVVELFGFVVLVFWLVVVWQRVWRLLTWPLDCG